MSHVEDRWFRTVTGPDGRQVKEQKARNSEGLRWRVRYKDPDGRERSESFAKKSDADRFRTQIDADLLRGTYRDPGAGRITLRKYATDWLAIQNFDAVTREAVESRLRIHILPALGSCRLDELAARPTLIMNWLQGLQKGDRRLASSTAAKVLSHLNTIMIAAVHDGRIAVNPCASRGVKPPRSRARKIEPWTLEQAAAVRAALPERLAAIVDAGTGLGLRQSELFGLSVGEIDFLRRDVHVRQQVKLIGGRPHFAPPKMEKERHVPLAPQTAGALAAHLAAFPASAVTLPWHEPGNRARHGQPRTEQLVFTGKGAALHRNAFNISVWRPAILPGRPRGVTRQRLPHDAAPVRLGADLRRGGRADRGGIPRPFRRRGAGAENLLAPDAGGRRQGAAGARAGLRGASRKSGTRPCDGPGPPGGPVSSVYTSPPPTGSHPRSSRPGHRSGTSRR